MNKLKIYLFIFLFSLFISSFSLFIIFFYNKNILNEIPQTEKWFFGFIIFTLSIIFQTFLFFIIQKNNKRKWLQYGTGLPNKNKDLQLALLEDREKYRREFLGNVSHELKTPLFTIQGFTLNLLDGAIKEKKIRKKYLERINKSVERLIFIVKDLDVLSESETGNLNLNYQKFNLKLLIEELFELLEMKAKKNHVLLKVDETLQTNYFVNADRERIAQVLTNLVVNAISHSKKNNSEVTISIKTENNTCKVSVCDNGIGISSKHLPRIFERFYRVDPSRSRKHGGSGLGLAIVKHIIEAHNQKIEVKSKKNKGSCFSFTLEKVSP